MNKSGRMRATSLAYSQTLFNPKAKINTYVNYPNKTEEILKKKSEP